MGQEDNTQSGIPKNSFLKPLNPEPEETVADDVALTLPVDQVAFQQALHSPVSTGTSQVVLLEKGRSERPGFRRLSRRSPKA